MAIYEFYRSLISWSNPMQEVPSMSLFTGSSPLTTRAYFEDVAFSDRMKYNKTRVNQTPRERTQVI